MKRLMNFDENGDWKINRKLKNEISLHSLNFFKKVVIKNFISYAQENFVTFKAMKPKLWIKSVYDIWINFK